MQLKLETPESIGPIVKAVRKSQRIRQDDAAGSIGVSENFLGKVEKGADRLQWVKLFQVLAGLGIQIELDIPDDIAAEVAKKLAENPAKS